MVGVRVSSRKFDFSRWGIEDTFQKWEEVMSDSRMSTCNFDDILLEDSHPVVQRSLQAAIEHNKKDLETTWLDLHMAFYREKGISWGTVKAPSDVRSSVWWSVTPARDQDIIACAHAIMGKRLPSVGDSSQNINITPFSSKRLTANNKEIEVSPAALPNAKWWHFKKKGFVIGEEQMCGQGFPTRAEELKELMEGTDDSTAHKLGGDAFTGTVVLVVKWAIIRACPWRPGATLAVSDEATNGALAALAASSSSA